MPIMQSYSKTSFQTQSIHSKFLHNNFMPILTYNIQFLKKIQQKFISIVQNINF